MEYTQDMVNKIDAQITKELESGKSINQIEKEIKKKMAEMKPVKTISAYNAGRELLNIIDRADSLKANLEANKAKIDRNYKAEIIEKKERELELEFIGDLASLKFDLGKVKEKESKYKQDAIMNNKLAAEYQASKREAFDVLLKLGDKLEADLVVELLQPMIEAKDLSSIRILEKTASKENKIAYIEAIRKVEEFINTDNTDCMIDEVSKYLNNKMQEKSLILMQMIQNTR